jgi:hypothetical protein
MSRKLSDSARRQRAHKVSRRAFGQLLVGATAAAAVPLFVPARLLGTAAPDVQVYSSYRELLAHPDLDAVVISTPDHWHAQLAPLTEFNVFCGQPTGSQLQHVTTLPAGGELSLRNVGNSAATYHVINWKSH